jgi:hypothetical protein
MGALMPTAPIENSAPLPMLAEELKKGRNEIVSALF